MSERDQSLRRHKLRRLLSLLEIAVVGIVVAASMLIGLLSLWR